MTIAAVAQHLPRVELDSGLAAQVNPPERLPAPAGSAVRFEKLLETASTGWENSQQDLLKELANADQSSSPIAVFKVQMFVSTQCTQTALMSNCVGSVHGSVQSLLQAGG
jgi:hypothetical protein